MYSIGRHCNQCTQCASTPAQNAEQSPSACETLGRIAIVASDRWPVMSTAATGRASRKVVRAE